MLFAGQVSSKFYEDEAATLYATLGFFSRDCQETVQEILRQVLVAAGFGSKQGAMRRDALSK
ncbi:Homeodomain-like transcriptional regulator, partial [Prunus dulcis]